MSYLSRREIDDIRPDLDKVLYKVLGNSDSGVLSTVEHCLHNGFDRRKTADKLSSLLDNKKAVRLSDKIEDLLESLKSSSKPRKRTHEDDFSKERGDSKRSKPKEEKSVSSRDKKIEVEARVEEIKDEPPSNLTSNQIKQMMANAQREIEERKRALTNLKSNKAAPLIIPPGLTPSEIGAQLGASPPIPTKPEDIERARKIAELQAQIRAKLSGTLAGIIPTDKPTPLILDAEGRTVDKSGRAINIPTLLPTLKANIRAKKRENFKTQMTEKQEEFNEAKFFDERITLKPALRNKRALRFHEPEKFIKMAEKMRMKAQLEKLQNEISQIARKTGISSATKLALIAPKQDSHSDEVPQMEWWDSVILTMDMNTLVNDKISIRESAVSNLIEHPTQMRPPSKFTFSFCFFQF